MAKETKSPKKSDEDISLNQTEEFTYFNPDPIPAIMEEPVKEEVKVEPPKANPKVRKYVCRTKCWVSSKCQMFNPGDIAEFVDGEFIPSHFELIE